MFTVETNGQFSSGNLYVKQGGRFDITCSASGGPNNTHTWRRNGIEVINSNTFTITSTINDIESESILSVSEINAAIHQGSYECEVINNAGDEKRELTIHGKG